MGSSTVSSSGLMVQGPTTGGRRTGAWCRAAPHCGCTTPQLRATATGQGVGPPPGAGLRLWTSRAQLSCGQGSPACGPCLYVGQGPVHTRPDRPPLQEPLRRGPPRRAQMGPHLAAPQTQKAPPRAVPWRGPAGPGPGAVFHGAQPTPCPGLSPGTMPLRAHLGPLKP